MRRIGAGLALTLALAFSTTSAGLAAGAPAVSTPEVNPVGSDFTIYPQPQAFASCAGEDPGTIYQVASGVWPGGVSDASLPGVDVPVAGSLKVTATFLIAIAGPDAGTGVAFGTMNLSTITGPTIKGPFELVLVGKGPSDSIDGRGFWNASINGGADSGHSVWANFEIRTNWPWNNQQGPLRLIQGNFGDFSHTLNYPDFSAEYNNRVCAAPPEAGFAGASATLNPVANPVVTSCVGEDNADSYNQVKGTWTGVASDLSSPGIDVPLNGGLTVSSTFVEAASGQWTGNGVAFGKATLLAAGGKKLTGPFNAVTERVDANTVTGRGFWNAKIPGGDSLWANFEVEVVGATVTFTLGTLGSNDLPFSAEYNNQTC